MLGLKCISKRFPNIGFRTRRLSSAAAHQKEIRDSYVLPQITLPRLPVLSNFGAAKEFFSKKVLEGNKELDKVWVAPEGIANAFRTIFPEIVESRGITKLENNVFQNWDTAQEIPIELDEGSMKADEHAEVLSVGGPAALSAALLYKLQHPVSEVTYAVTNRQDSNHDGSAYYFHERDAFPVYINKVNRGPYCVYIDLWKRFISRKKLLSEAINNRHHVKISLNWKNITPSMVFGIFVPNFWHMLGDIYLKNPVNTVMRNTVEHAKKTHEIVEAVSRATGMPKTAMVICGHEKACYVGFAGGTSPKKHFTWLNKYTEIPFTTIDHEKAFGKTVAEVVSFPRDGMMSPWIFENIKTQLKKMDCKVRDNFKVVKLLATKSGEEDTKITKVVWEDTNTGKQRIVSVDKLFFSFGPSATVKVNLPPYSLASHFMDVLAGKENNVYAPTWTSLGRHLVNDIKHMFMGGKQVLNKFMWAAGSTSVLMIGADLEKAPKEHLEMLTKFMDGVNQHWTIIAQRDVIVENKPYRFFAIQMTGGGNFPSRKILPDYLVNLLHTTESMMRLGEVDYLMYDCVQSRGCGRAVSAKNSVAFAPIASNAVGAYAQGGIGMTTMFPNAQLMIELLHYRLGLGAGDLKTGHIGNAQTVENFYNKQILAGTNYTTLVDSSVRVSRYFGWEKKTARTVKVADKIPVVMES